MSALPISNPPSFYVVGGTMRPDALSYVRRDADEELYNGLVENEFCHVLTARQMGKSSLMLRTATRLRKSGMGVAALDLTGIGTNLSAEQWYSGLIIQMGDRLNLEDELLEFWQANVSLGPMQRWISAIRKVVLPLHPCRLAIFIDEIDAVASLNFSTDEFFSGIRECYNLRNEDREINRLTFCLLGVASPADLIRDTRTTPFNVGRRIELNDFTKEEALSLAAGLGHSDAENHALLKRVFYWTNGHPYLTQRLCKEVSKKRTDGNLRGIDDAIDRMFFSKRAQEYDDNLIFVRERLLRSGADVADLLNLYSRVRRRKTVIDDDSQPPVTILRLSGITRAEDGRLRVRNRIYERVFNDEWVKANLPGAEVRRQRAAFRRGVIRTTAVAVVILTVVAALAITAFRQRNLAREQTAVNNRLLYAARMKLANQEYDNANIARVEKLVELTTPNVGEEDLRGFEWFLFWGYAHAETMRFKEPGQIASAKFFSGDATIAVAEVIHAMIQQRREYLLKFFDRRSQKEAMSFSVPAGTNFDVAVFSPDNKYVATDSPDNSVALWDLSSKQQVHKLQGPGKPIVWLAFAPDQQSLACTFVGGTFKVWDLASGKQKFEGHSQLETPGIAFSSDGKQLAVGMRETVTEILDADTGKPLRSLSSPKGTPGLIFFSPDGTGLFATTSEGDIYCWVMRDGQLLDFGDGHSNEVLSFSFSPDGKILATGSLDRTLKLWDVATGRELRTIMGHGAWVTSLHFSAEGRYLLSGDSDGLIKVWDLAGKEMPVWPDQKPTSVSATTFTPGNDLIAIGRAADAKLRIWNLSNGRTVADLGSAQTISSAAFSKDAALVAAAVAPQIRIYSVATGQLISTLAAPAVDVYSLEFSPDGTKLLSGDRQGNVILSEVSSGRAAERLNGKNMYYRAVFSPDGKQIASADQDGKVRIWDVASTTIDKTLIGHTGVAKLISFSPDGRLLATAADDNTVRIWDTASGKELGAPVHSDSVQRFAFTPDGKRLVTASLDGAVVLWDVTGMQEIVTLRKRGGPPSSVSFSQNGLVLAVSDENGAIRVWQAGQPSG
jgi:WD40 repeat protein